MSSFHISDVGPILEMTVKNGSAVADLSSATTKHFIFQKPDGSKITRDAAFTTDGSDGKLNYAWITGDLDMAGTWLVEVYAVSPSWTLHSDLKQFRVREIL